MFFSTKEFGVRQIPVASTRNFYSCCYCTLLFTVYFICMLQFSGEHVSGIRFSVSEQWCGPLLLEDGFGESQLHKRFFLRCRKLVCGLAGILDDKQGPASLDAQ